MSHMLLFAILYDCEVFGLKIKVPLKERCPLCRSFLNLRTHAKVDKSIDIEDDSQAELYAHHGFWLKQNYTHTMNFGSTSGAIYVENWTAL